MTLYGDLWVDELVNSATFTTPGRKAAARSQLKAMVALLNEHAAQPDPPPVPAPSIFAQPGWMAVRYDKLPSPAELAAARVKWVTAILSHGVDGNGGHSLDTDDRENQGWLATGSARAYRDAGVKVGGWAWQQGFNAGTEAQIAKTYIESWALDLWIANGEEVWKGNDQPGKFAAAFASVTPAGLPVAWSVLGAAHGQNVYPFDYQAFTSRGWHILPQAYPQQSADYKLSLCIDHAVRAGIPLNLVHPTIANYGLQSPQAYWPTMEGWAIELREAKARGVTGFSVWSHDFTVEQVRDLVGVTA